MVTPDFDAIKKKLSGVFSTMRVMVVDDMPMNLDSYRLILQGLGVQRSNIFSATNGLKAVTSMVSTKPDLILSDWNMPVMDGLTATQLIRKHELASGISRTPIIAVTAHAMAGDEEKALEAGCNDYLTKPIDEEELWQKVEKLLA